MTIASRSLLHRAASWVGGLRGTARPPRHAAAGGEEPAGGARATEVPSLRIAHVLPAFAIGGQERVALDLARTHAAAGHRLFAFSLEPRPEGDLIREFRACGVATRTVPKGPRVDPTLVLRLALQFARERIDVVHTHNPFALFYGAPAAKLAGAAAVHTKHGENLEQHGRRVIARRIVGRLADAFVAVSPTTAAAARRTRDVAARRIRVIPNGIDTARYGPDPRARSDVRRELGIPEDAWVAGTVGRLASEKNQKLLLESLAGALHERARVVIVGEGPERGALAAAAAGLNLTPWVHLTGARADVQRLLAAFDVFALPSISEGLPLVVLEAMATALPIVASRVGGVPDVILEGETGLLVPPGDRAALRSRLLELAADRAAADALGARARRVALERYSLEHMAGEYMEIYQRLARGRRGAGWLGRSPARAREGRAAD
jgi:glycosyltransferase involved in cell wall biosynthesis